MTGQVDTAVTTRTTNMAGAYGLSIYWPEDRPYDFSSDYNESEVSLLGVVDWDGFLSSYWSHTA